MVGPYDEPSSEGLDLLFGFCTGLGQACVMFALALKGLGWWA